MALPQKDKQTQQGEAVVALIGSAGLAWLYLHDTAWTLSVLSGPRFMWTMVGAVFIGLWIRWSRPRKSAVESVSHAESGDWGRVWKKLIWR